MQNRKPVYDKIKPLGGDDKLELTEQYQADSIGEGSVKDAVRGNKAAFSKLFKQHYNTIYRVSRSILKNESDIEDALQEAAIKAYKGIGKLKDVSMFKSWLIRIAINESYNIIRKNKNHIPLDTLEDNISPEEESSSNMDIRRAILNLEEDLRLVTVLYYYEDLPVKSISTIMNIPEGTVKSRLSRARNKLLKDLNIKEGV